MIQKLWHKKWMVLCLLLGSLLLTATVVSFPLYRSAAFDRMLQDEFRSYQAENGQWPAQNEMTIISKKDKEGKAISRMEGLMEDINGQLGVTAKNTIYYYSLSAAEAHSLMKREDAGKLSLRLGFLSDLPEHAALTGGEMYSEDGLSEDGSFEVVISQSCMVSANLLVGETLEFDALKDSEGNPIRMKITGVFEEGGEDAFYWQVTPETLNGVCLMNEKLFREKFLGEKAAKYTMTCSYFPQFEYGSLKASQVGQLVSATDYLLEESPYRSTMSKPAYRDILESFQKKQARIEATLFLLQIPVLILLCAFLFMISGQMYDMERNEISVIKSRGSSSGQIFRLYLYQSILLTVLGAVLGVPLGTLFCRILGAARNFLEFDVRRELAVSFTTEAAWYMAGAMAVSVLIMTLPAWKHSRITIVKLKAQKALKKKAWWEKCFLDVICLGIALYGYYNYYRNKEELVRSVLQNKALDPLLYISSALFIIGMGLLFLRLQPVAVKLIYLAGRRFWKPASYASFMENLKNGRKQQFIMLFLILTIALGMFHATVARTILQNAIDNTDYLAGADLIIREKWDDNAASLALDNTAEFQYYEPDFSKYASLASAKSCTRVIYDAKAYFSSSGNSRQNIILMGIHTKEFGENTRLPEKLLEKPYYEYLNELAVEPGGILVSRNFQTVLGYKTGDTITYYNQDKKQATGKIIDFFDYWPGYAPETSMLNPDGTVAVNENYLLVAHFDALQRSWGTTPYEVWITMKEGSSTEQIYSWLEENDVRVVKYSDRQKNLEDTVEDPLLQGTNGVLTMGFMVTILLCGVGYLIYWIMSIRAREMIFGVLRACGMHKGELFHMLINEQIFSGVFSILAGIGIGRLTSVMFVPMLQTAYAAANQVLPMQLITNSGDMVRLYGVILGVMAVCLGILILLVFKLNVAKALKLGEE